MWLVGHWNLSWSWALWTRRMSHEHVWWIEAWCWGITRCGMGEGWRWDIKMTGTIWKVQMQTSYWPGRNAIESLRRKIRPSEDLGMKCFSVNLQKFDSQMICSKSFPFEHIFQVFPCFWWKARSKASKVNLFGIPRPRSVHAMLEFIGWKIIGVWKPWMEAPGWMVNDFNQDGAMMPRCPKVGRNDIRQFSCWKMAPNTWNHPWCVPRTPTRTPLKKVWNITNHTFSIQLVPKRP